MSAPTPARSESPVEQAAQELYEVFRADGRDLGMKSWPDWENAPDDVRWTCIDAAQSVIAVMFESLSPLTMARALQDAPGRNRKSIRWDELSAKEHRLCIQEMGVAISAARREVLGHD